MSPAKVMSCTPEHRIHISDMVTPMLPTLSSPEAESIRQRLLSEVNKQLNYLIEHFPETNADRCNEVMARLKAVKSTEWWLGQKHHTAIDILRMTIPRDSN